MNSAGQAFGCGQCLPCLISRRRVWAHRIMLETVCHDHSAFVTLTYKDEHEPPLRSLSPKDLQDFLKRLRKSLEPDRIRFYAVGEYGDQTSRPHYHLAVFGMPTCRYLRSRTEKIHTGRSCCFICDSLRDVWGKGHVYLGTLENDSAHYIAQYVTKKMTSKDDPRLNGRHPEFARMSNRPGIGFHAMHEVASTLMKFNLDETQADVPSALQHGRRKMPLGRYLQGKLRNMVGKDEKAPQAVHDKIHDEMLAVRIAAHNSGKTGGNPSVRSQLLLKNQGKVASLEARAKIMKQRKTI